MDCKSFKSILPYFLVHLKSCLFDSCERKTLQDVDKNSNSFNSKKLANSSEYIQKEKCQVDLNHLKDSQYKVKELSEKIA